ncbi:MAG: hypothetical protein HQL20_05580 [Candidatus Omnitrophica bacterium]|nr:hypothetical protein [Candidatus Omnitrophota bacterium]
MKIISAALTFFLTFVFAFQCLAQEVYLEPVYGKGLFAAPAAARLKFQNETGMSWYDVTVRSRYDFLLKWEAAQKAAAQARFKEDQARAALNKIKSDADKARMQKARARAKVEAARLKVLANEKRASDKQIAAMKKQRAKTLRELRRKQKARTSKARSRR